MKTVELPYPVSDAVECTEAIVAALRPRTVLAIVDHVTSSSALVLPIAEIVARCRARGVPGLVDGAHAPGAIAVDLAAIAADWYTANLHKWAWAPRSCGVLWAPAARQEGLHPPVISWGLDKGFATEFDWVGTRDPSPWLTAPAAIALLREFGAEAVRAYDHALAVSAANALRDGVGAERMSPDGMIGTMATVRLPARYGSSLDDAARLRDALLFEDGVEVQMHAWRERIWVRVSAQVYNDATDIERLVRGLANRCPG